MTRLYCARARARGVRLGAGVALALALGCAGAGAGARHAALVDRMGRTAPAAGIPSLDDDPFAGSAVLERAAVVEAVLRRNPTLRSAREAWRAALARFPQATALADPTLRYAVAPRSLAASDVRDMHLVELGQPIPFPGTLALRGEAALAEAEAAGHELGAARLRLATSASLLFDDAYATARALEVNHHHRELLEEIRAVARARYEAGEVSAQAPLQAEVELGQLERERASLEAEQALAAQALNALLHRHPDAPLPPPPQVLDPGAEEEADVDGRVAAALAARPELLAAEARVRGGEAAVALARRAFLPEVTLTAGYDGGEDAAEMRPMVGVALEVPLQVGRRRAALEEARAGLEAARSDRAAVEAEVRLAVRSGAERAAAARRVLLVVRDRLLPAARDQLDAARAAFETGQESFLAVIVAERDLRDVELAEHRALADLDRRLAELASASGVVPGLHGGESR